MPKKTTPEDQESDGVPKLSHREMMFCHEFIKTDNGAQSVINAGYLTNSNSAAVQASKLLKRPHIKKFLLLLFEAELGPAKILTKQILRETKAIALGNIEDVMEVNDNGRLNLLPTKDVGRDKLRAVKAYTETINEYGGSSGVQMHDKLKGIELLMKYLKLFDDKDQDGPRKDIAHKKSERAKLLELYRKPTRT